MDKIRSNQHSPVFVGLGAICTIFMMHCASLLTKNRIKIKAMGIAMICEFALLRSRAPEIMELASYSSKSLSLRTFSNILLRLAVSKLQGR